MVSCLPGQEASARRIGISVVTDSPNSSRNDRNKVCFTALASLLRNLGRFDLGEEYPGLIGLPMPRKVPASYAVYGIIGHLYGIMEQQCRNG